MCCCHSITQGHLGVFGILRRYINNKHYNYYVVSPQNFDEPKSKTRQDESTNKLRSPQGDPLPNAPVRLMVPLPSMIHPLVFPQMDGALLPNNPRSPTPSKTLMQPSHLDFVYFVNLFRSFCICSRKDLKDLFEQFATTTPRLERKMPKELLNEQPPSRDSGECMSWSFL